MPSFPFPSVIRCLLVAMVAGCDPTGVAPSEPLAESTRALQVPQVPFPASRIAYTEGGQPRFEVAGQQLLPLYLNGSTNLSPVAPFNQWPDVYNTQKYEEEVRHFADAGGKVVAFSMALNETVDFQRLDKAIELTRLNAPNAYIIIRVNVHNTTTAKLEALKADGSSAEVPAYRALGDEFVALTNRRFSLMLAHLKQTGASSRVIGIHLTYMAEWFYPSAESTFPDYSASMKQLFQGLPEFVGAATPPEIPLPSSRLSPSIGTSVLDSAQRTNEVLFDRLLHRNTAKVLDQIAGAIRAQEPNLLIGVFYGYSFEMGERLVNSGHAAVDELLASNNIDMVMAPYSYGTRGVGGSIKPHGMIDTFASRGKLFILEDDTYTHVGLPPPEGVTAGGFEPGLTLTNVYDEFLRNGLSMLQHRAGFYWLDLLGDGRHNDPALWGAYKQIAQIYTDEATLTQEPPEIAVIHDDSSVPFMVPGKAVLPRMFLADAREAFEKSGMSVGYFGTDDVIRKRLSLKTRMIVFLDYVRRNPQLEAALDDRYRRDGRVIVYSSGLALVDKDGLPTSGGAEAVTGLSFDSDKGPLKARDNSGTEVGRTLTFEPRLSVTSADATVLARYINSNKAAVAYAPRGGGWVAFAGVPLNSAMIRTLGTLAKAHVFVSSERAQVISTPTTLGLYVQKGTAENFDLRLPEELALARTMPDGGITQLGASKSFRFSEDPGTMVLLRKMPPESKGRAWVEAEGALVTRRGKWKVVYSQGGYSAGAMLESSASGDSLETKVWGTAVSIFSSPGPGRGTAKVSVDGSQPVSVNLYNSKKQPVREYTIVSNLTPGDHVVRIEASSGSGDVDIDAVKGTAPSFVEAESNQVIRDGAGWQSSPLTTAVSEVKGCRIIANITGSTLAMVANPGPNRGIAAVSIDGERPFDVDLFNAGSYLYGVRFPLASGLPDGPHRVVIEVSGRTSAPGPNGGTYLVIDSIGR